MPWFTTSAEGQTLDIIFSKVDKPDGVRSIVFNSATISTDSYRGFYLTSDYYSSMNMMVGINKPEGFNVTQSEFSLPGNSESVIYFGFNPLDTIEYYSPFILYNADFEEPFRLMRMRGAGAPWPVEGDYNFNGWIDPADVVGYLGYLYRNQDLPVTPIDLDLDDSGDISIADVVYLINLLFFSR